MTSTILITGCSSDIGLDAARTLAARGWRVFATCRKAEDAARLEDEGLESLVLDYADPNSVASAVAEVAARYPALWQNNDPAPEDTPPVWQRFLRDPVGFSVYGAVALATKLPQRGAERWARGR